MKNISRRVFIKGMAVAAAATAASTVLAGCNMANIPGTGNGDTTVVPTVTSKTIETGLGDVVITSGTMDLSTPSFGSVALKVQNKMGTDKAGACNIRVFERHPDGTGRWDSTASGDYKYMLVVRAYLDGVDNNTFVGDTDPAVTADDIYDVDLLDSVATHGENVLVNNLITDAPTGNEMVYNRTLYFNTKDLATHSEKTWNTITFAYQLYHFDTKDTKWKAVGSEVTFVYNQK